MLTQNYNFSTGLFLRQLRFESEQNLEGVQDTRFLIGFEKVSLDRFGVDIISLELLTLFDLGSFRTGPRGADIRVVLYSEWSHVISTHSITVVVYFMS